MARFSHTAFAVAASLFSIAAFADPVPLTEAIQCSEGTQNFGIAVTDVTGNNGGATDCWGAYQGNDPATDEAFVIDDPDSVYDGATFDFVAKQNTPGALEGDDIGLVVSGPAQSGTWQFNQGALDDHDFLIVLKAANNPGFATWLFAGNPDATSFSGNWSVAWGPDLSHLSVYKSSGPPFTPPNGVPAPAPLPLLAIGLIAWVARSRKK